VRDARAVPSPRGQQRIGGIVGLIAIASARFSSPASRWAFAFSAATRRVDAVQLAQQRRPLHLAVGAARLRLIVHVPGAQIGLRERYSDDILRLVTENAADFGIYHAETAAPGVHSVRYRQDRVVLVMLVDYPLATLDEAALEAAEDCLLVGYFPLYSYEGFLPLAEASLWRSLSVRIEVSNSGARCRLIREEVGIGAMRKLIAASNLSWYGLKAYSTGRRVGLPGIFHLHDGKRSSEPAAGIGRIYRLSVEGLILPAHMPMA
jgi:hypothetical protein